MKKLREIQSCRNCNLCYNQPPLLDNHRKAQIFWVGLSAVKVSDIKKEIPLSSNTKTGKLLSFVEKDNNQFSYYKTNLVKCLPLEKNKIRYPNVHEMESCFKNLRLEIKRAKPRIIFLLGKAVTDFIMKFEKRIIPFLDEKFNYQSYKINNIYYVPVHHPSYILIYKRKLLEKYTTGISSLLTDLAIS